MDAFSDEIPNLRDRPAVVETMAEGMLVLGAERWMVINEQYPIAHPCPLASR
ncbi:MAG: hypothetical protein JWL79_922 [Frankiales bacterium]|nr:hypothetical protein [Frankiales bacterium]